MSRLCLRGKGKQHVMSRKRKQTQTLNFLTVFSCSKVFAHWFCLHGFASGVWGSFSELTPKMRIVIFSVLSSSWLVFQCSLRLLATHFKFSRPPISACYCREENLFLLVINLHRKFGSSIFFLFILNLRSHSLGTGWHTTSVLAWATRTSATSFRCISVCCFVLSSFIFFLSLPRSSPLLLFYLPCHVTEETNRVQVIPIRLKNDFVPLLRRSRKSTYPC